MARVGILVECGRDGLEVHVCRRICHLLRQQHGIKLEEQIVPMDNKNRLLQECTIATRNLFTGGCERVVILWDERPAWPDEAQQLCWHQERERILGELRGQRLAKRPVFLVCIEREFESWLLHDERLLSLVLSTPAHPVKIPRQTTPHRLKNPKGTMITVFRKYGGKRYVDVLYARRLADGLQDLSRLKRCATFARFAEKVAGKKI